MTRLAYFLGGHGRSWNRLFPESCRMWNTNGQLLPFSIVLSTRYAVRSAKNVSLGLFSARNWVFSVSRNCSRYRRYFCRPPSALNGIIGARRASPPFFFAEWCDDPQKCLSSFSYLLATVWSFYALDGLLIYRRIDQKRRAEIMRTLAVLPWFMFFFERFTGKLSGDL